MSDQGANQPAQAEPQIREVSVPSENIHLHVAGVDMRFATIAELFAEIERRSVGVLLMSYNIEGLQGMYHSKVRGDSVCLRSLSMILASEIENVIRPPKEGPKQ